MLLHSGTFGKYNKTYHGDGPTLLFFFFIIVIIIIIILITSLLSKTKDCIPIAFGVGFHRQSTAFLLRECELSTVTE